MSKKPCKVEGCANPFLARGYCPKHYQAWRIHGESLRAEPKTLVKDALCALAECDIQARTMGWCGGHYARWRKHGDPRGGGVGAARGTAESRFLAKFTAGGINECWRWTGSQQAGGYAGFGAIPGQTTSAHRFSYEYHVGPIPEGHVIRHKCDNRMCVNPNHLETGTPAENMQDRTDRHRSPWRKVSNQQVAEIRAKALGSRPGLTASIAEEYGVSAGYIRRVVRREYRSEDLMERGTAWKTSA